MKEFQFTIRLDLIMIIVIVCKIWELIDISWITIYCLIFIPMIFFNLLGKYLKRKLDILKGEK